MKPLDIKLKRLPPEVEIRLKVTSQYKVRMWIATRLFKLAALIMGARSKAETQVG